ncbi:MAG: T9SS type A sorting domain-containing protein [Bacteroidales bacterium]|nr:T9SS type A sorting domain-containing protein [Bacteroidales bacterium]MCF8390748.1 T9SS type A sorting domain-containing protein [Bacteroidales bacterium]
MKRYSCITLLSILSLITFSQSGWHWQNPLPQGNPLNSIHFCAHSGWAVGENGTALHMKDYGEVCDIKPLFDNVTSIYEQKLVAPGNNIRLLQNIPNPFTGISTIGWSSRHSGQTLLKVFNISGQEIATLVNKFMPEGIHSVDFNAASLSKGVYYYQLRIGNEIESKKMIIQ